MVHLGAPFLLSDPSSHKCGQHYKTSHLQAKSDNSRSSHTLRLCIWPSVVVKPLAKLGRHTTRQRWPSSYVVSPLLCCPVSCQAPFGQLCASGRACPCLAHPPTQLTKRVGAGVTSDPYWPLNQVWSSAVLAVPTRCCAALSWKPVTSLIFALFWPCGLYVAPGLSLASAVIWVALIGCPIRLIHDMLCLFEWFMSGFTHCLIYFLIWVMVKFNCRLVHTLTPLSFWFVWVQH
jgi:hypothetical protein